MSRVLVWMWSHGGGGSQFAFDLARRLQRDRGRDQVVLSMKEGDPIAEIAASEGLEVRLANVASHRSQPIASLAGLNRARQVIAEHAADVDVVVAAMNFATLAPLSLALKKTLVYCAHDPMPHMGDYAALGQRVSQRILLARADKVVAHSDYAASLLSRDAHVAKKLTVAPLQSVFAPQANQSGAITGPKRLLFTGRMIAYKGGILLADALDLLKGRDDWRLSVVGEGPAMTDELIKRLSSSQLDTLRTKFVSRAQLNEFFSACDVVLAPYLEASQSGIVADALAHGKPCLVTPVGALPEQIGHGVAGWIAENVTARAFADTLERVLTEEIASEQGGAARIANEHWNRQYWQWL